MASEAKPTRDELSILLNCARLAGHDMTYAPARRKPNRHLQGCLDAGWIEEDGMGVRVDGDGFAIQPEREVMGYRLTDAGRVVIEVRDGE